MAGDIRISEEVWWMVAGWAFRGVLRSVLGHIPASMPAFKSLVEERINGWNFFDVESDCTAEERIALLDALRAGYKDVEAAGPSSFGDPSYFDNYMEGFAELIQMIEKELKRQEEDGPNDPSMPP